MPRGNWDYTQHIYALIANHKGGQFVVTYNRKKYKVRAADARVLAATIWGYETGMSRAYERTEDGGRRYFMSIHSSGSRTFDDRMRELGALPKPPKKPRKGERSLRYSWEATPRGMAIARACFEQITGRDLKLAANESLRLEAARKEADEARERRVRECLRGLHGADGQPIHRLTWGINEANELAIAEQIAHLTKLAAKAVNAED